MSQPETRLVNRIMKALEGYSGIVVIKIHGSPYSRKGEPDIVGCHLGKAFAIEVKVGRNRLSLLQRYRLREWKRAGALVGVARSVEDALNVVIEGKETHGEEFLSD